MNGFKHFLGRVFGTGYCYLCEKFLTKPKGMFERDSVFSAFFCNDCARTVHEYITSLKMKQVD